ncbi:hypothetical protein [uncultured Dokdonia sp.]|uniref:hypothetical protein n=1 Tax=uncultured Dokdonia sp. TaxID=575653 RepID=UPI00260CB951|nr:hypothetical protein [uncultured Dokdonia sp.]
MKQHINNARMFFIVVMLSTLIPSCSSIKKEVAFKNDMNSIQINNDNCPNNGNCAIAIKKGSYTIETDTTGAMYPLFTEGDGELVEFTYEVPAKEGIADGNYKETILFIVPKGLKGFMVLEDASLSKLKLLLNKECFCRGQAGYHLITQGKLAIKRNAKNEISFDLNYQIDGIDMVISSIEL